jgi:hypothetical protein
MPTYCAYEGFTAEEWSDFIDNGDLYPCDDPHCGECDNYCDGCRECAPNDYDSYGRRPVLEDVWPRTINSYSFKPSPLFWSTGGFQTARLTGRYGKRHLFFGTEIEVEPDHSMLDRDQSYATFADTFAKYEDLTERLYCKHDGSLNDGVELVSHPMTLDAWQELHSDGDLRFFRDIGRQGMKATHHCGQHVHLNKSAFLSMGHMARFTHLIIDNPAYFKCVADRDEEGYASFVQFKISEVIRSNGNIYGPRGAVNLSNSATVEVRMFAASLRPKVIMGNIEVCAAIHAYTASRIPECKGIADHLSFFSFVEWTSKHRDQYPNALPMLANALQSVSGDDNRDTALALRRRRYPY